MKLNKDLVAEIRSLPMTDTIIEEVSRRYGISSVAARNVITGVSYSNLPGARELVRQRSFSKLTHEEVEEIKKQLESPWWGQVSDLARRYGVTHSEISHIKHGRAWL